jgi:mono/diheme cytochrome c family protein
MRKVLKWFSLFMLAGLLGIGAWVGSAVFAYNRSMATVYDVPVPAVTLSTDSLVIARGKHLVESVAGCASGDCHGIDLGGGTPIEAGPVGTIAAPNITSGGVGADYWDGEIARLILHGIRRDGRSVRFMPSQDLAWLPDDDIAAIISYVRSVPAVDRPSGPVNLGILAKVLDRRSAMVVDVARRIDHTRREQAPPPAPTAAYGAYLAKSCVGCHGEHLSGGKIPGTPPSLPIPANLTPHATGLASWSFADFEKVLTTGIRPDGRKLDPFMPIESLGKMNDTEKRAIWEYLRGLPPVVGP